MSPKLAQDRRDRSIPDVPLQPYALTAAEIPYRLSHAIPPRSTYQSFQKGSGSTTTTTDSNPKSTDQTGGSYPPYRQRLVAAALGTTDDPHSSYDSSSTPSSNALSSGVGTSSGTSSSSPTDSKGKGKCTSVVLSVSRVQAAPASAPSSIPAPEAAEFDHSTSYYELLMAHNAGVLPAPGPLHFEQRRALWTVAPPTPPAPPSPSPSRVKLEALLSQPGAVESEDVWRAGLKNVWKGLVGGNQLRKRLPLAIVLKILQAGWLRDGTWPEGMVAPAWDQSVQPSASPAPTTDTHPQSQPQRTQQQYERDQQRRAHEQEAYAAALHARASAEQSSAGQIMHMPAYAMMAMGGGIPPGYSPSSGDAEEGYYAMPYSYAEETPPPGDEIGPEEEAEAGREDEEGPPPTPVYAVQDLESEMDTEEEEEEHAGAEHGGRMEGVVQTGDGRHEGG